MEKQVFNIDTNTPDVEVQDLGLGSYQLQAMLFRLPSASPLYALLNLSAEVGELQGKIAKAIRDKTQLDKDEVFKELGDVLWMVAAVAADYDFKLEEVAKGNLEKLSSRSKRNVLTGSGDNR